MMISNELKLAAEPAAAPMTSALSRMLARVMKVAVYVSAFLAPLFYLPFTADPLLAKVIFLELAAVVALAAWLWDVLSSRRISYRRSPLNAAWLAVAATLLLATIFSAAPWTSLWGNDPTGEKTLSLLAFVALAFIIGAVFRPGDVRRLSQALLVSLFVLGLFTLVTLLFGRAGVAVPAWLAVNPIGTVNALALVLAAGFVFSLALVLTAARPGVVKLLSRRVRVTAGITAALLLVDLLIIGFRLAWLGIAVVMMIALAFHFAKSWRMPREGIAASGGPPAPSGPFLATRSLVIAFILLILSLLLLFRPLPLVSRLFQPPLEVSPSLGATLRIGAKVLGSDPLLGFGPANFRTAFNRFRDSSLNATAFWQVRFSHGFSYLATLPATVGSLGLAAFLALAVSAVVMVVRALWRSETGDPYLWAAGLSALFVITGWLVYAGNFTATMLLFLWLGSTVVLASDSPPASSGPSWWRMARRTVLIDTPAVNVATSLVAVFAVAFSVVIIYFLAAAYAAEVYFARASRTLNLYGNTDSAVVFLNRAVRLNPKEDSYHQGLAQAWLVAVNRTITQAAGTPGQDLSTQFRTEFSSGVDAANAAVALSPENPQNWLILGSLYEAVIPFIPGADRFAADAYERASRSDPYDPTLKLSSARAALTAADAVSLQASQSPPGEARKRLDENYREALSKASANTGAALELKSDFAQAHFLMAQINLRQGNVAEALRKVEETARLAPQDIGVAFQLGFLYYRRGEFENAAREFRRAIALDDRYSNARYFLGLIYDRRGDRDGALSQFEKIAALNPGNSEVRRIVTNLKLGLPALSGIVPPATAPEVRREAPVAEPASGGPPERR